MIAKRVVLISQPTFMDAIMGIFVSIEDAMTALTTLKGQNAAKKADSTLQAMSQGLVNKMLDKKLNSVEVKERLLPKIEKAAPSR